MPREEGPNAEIKVWKGILPASGSISRVRSVIWEKWQWREGRVRRGVVDLSGDLGGLQSLGTRVRENSW